MSATTLSHFAPAAPFHIAVPRFLKLWFRRAHVRARDREALGHMSDRELSDMRTNRFEVLNELAKPFWRG